MWGSASTATKIGLLSAQPLVIAVIRFGIAGVVMLLVSHVIFKHRLPAGKEWRQVTLYGLLNITIYLGLFIIAMQTLTAGIGTLAIATNPVIISFLSVFLLKKKLSATIILSLVICSAGVICAAWPLFGTAQVSVKGLIIVLISMFFYSLAALYFSSSKWNGLNLFTINGWQTLIGGLMLLPFTWFSYQPEKNIYDFAFWISVSWLAIPVSVFAVLLWLWLLRVDSVKAGLWLFLCPVFGFMIAAIVMNDSITMFTIVGVLLVMSGLILSQQNIWAR